MKKIIKKIHRRHAIEVITYGLVGGSAWIAQTVIYLIAIRWGVFPSIAMILGNFLGMIVAYMGHVRFTFQRKHKFSHREFVKFTAASILGLCFNVGSVRVITKVLLCDPHYAVLPTLLTPLLTFLVSKFWAFRD